MSVTGWRDVMIFKSGKVLIVTIGAILMSGCNQSEIIPQEASEIGRYQIINDPKHDGVFWIDTATGSVEQCQWTDLNGGSWKCFGVK